MMPPALATGRCAPPPAEMPSLPARRRRRSREDQRGQGMVEYALILVLLAVVVLVVLVLVGNQVNNLYSNVSNGLGT